MTHRNNPIEIKGQKEGLWILLNDQLSFQDVLSALEQKLHSSNNFFSGADVALQVGTRELSDEVEQQLRKLIEEEYGLQIREIQQTPFPDTASPPMSDRLASENRDKEALSSEDVDPDDEFMKMLDETFRIPVAQRWEPKTTYSSDHLYEHQENAFYFRGTVRSGQMLEFPGNIVILGDVNPGAYVVASGDIIVMGRLNGVVHAGAEGEERAVIIGARFLPSQLRIAQYIGRPPDEHALASSSQPSIEKAYVKDGAIVIAPIV